MDFEVDIRQAVEATAGRVERSRSRVRRLADGDVGSSVAPSGRQVDAGKYSYSAECGCPDDCLRDHENE
jgi:hypothetical protein